MFEEFTSLAALLPQVVLDPLHQRDDLKRQLEQLEDTMDKRTKKVNELQDELDGRAEDGVDQVDQGVPGA